MYVCMYVCMNVCNTFGTKKIIIHNMYQTKIKYIFFSSFKYICIYIPSRHITKTALDAYGYPYIVNYVYIGTPPTKALELQNLVKQIPKATKALTGY